MAKRLSLRVDLVLTDDHERADHGDPFELVEPLLRRVLERDLPEVVEEVEDVVNLDEEDE